MQLKCVKAFGMNVPGDVVDAADGEFDPVHWELAAVGETPQAPPEPDQDAPASPAPAAFPSAVKEN